MKVTLAIISCVVFGSVHAQTLIGTAGNSSASGGVNVSWSMGESVIGTASGNGRIVTIGFQQAVSEIVSALIEDPEAGIALFPNPATEHVNFRFNALPEEAEFEIINNAGVTTIKQTLFPTDGRFTINVAALASGIYHVIVRSAGGKALTLRLVKL